MPEPYTYIKHCEDTINRVFLENTCNAVYLVKQANYTKCVYCIEVIESKLFDDPCIMK